MGGTGGGNYQVTKEKACGECQPPLSPLVYDILLNQMNCHQVDASKNAVESGDTQSPRPQTSASSKRRRSVIMTRTYSEVNVDAVSPGDAVTSPERGDKR